LEAQFIEQYSGILEKEDMNLVISQVIGPLGTIPSDDQITQFLHGHQEYMRQREDADEQWLAIKGDFKHPEAASIWSRRKEVGEAWKFNLERIFGIEGARLIVETP